MAETYIPDAIRLQMNLEKPQLCKAAMRLSEHGWNYIGGIKGGYWMHHLMGEQRMSLTTALETEFALHMGLLR